LPLVPVVAGVEAECDPRPVRPGGRRGRWQSLAARLPRPRRLAASGLRSGQQCRRVAVDLPRSPRRAGRSAFRDDCLSRWLRS
jgi:hypothetical protein